MTDMHGAAPEDMKPGQVYRVEKDKEHGGIRLEKVESSQKGEIVVLDMPANIAWILKLYATILDQTLESKILEDLQQIVENLTDGHILGQEIERVYGIYFKKETNEGGSKIEA